MVDQMIKLVIKKLTGRTSFMTVPCEWKYKKLNGTNLVGGGRTHWQTMESLNLGSPRVDFISHVDAPPSRNKWLTNLHVTWPLGCRSQFKFKELRKAHTPMISKASFTLGLQTKKPLWLNLNSLVWFVVISKKFRVGEISVSKMFHLF